MLLFFCVLPAANVPVLEQREDAPRGRSGGSRGRQCYLLLCLGETGQSLGHCCWHHTRVCKCHRWPLFWEQSKQGRCPSQLLGLPAQVSLDSALDFVLGRWWIRAGRSPRLSVSCGWSSHCVSLPASTVWWSKWVFPLPAELLGLGV